MSWVSISGELSKNPIFRFYLILRLAYDLQICPIFSEYTCQSIGPGGVLYNAMYSLLPAITTSVRRVYCLAINRQCTSTHTEVQCNNPPHIYPMCYIHYIHSCTHMLHTHYYIHECMIRHFTYLKQWARLSELANTPRLGQLRGHHKRETTDTSKTSCDHELRGPVSYRNCRRERDSCGRGSSPGTKPWSPSLGDHHSSAIRYTVFVPVQ